MGQSLVCIGAVNIDCIYSVDQILKQGESGCCDRYHRFWGGKGLNQTLALKKAGETPQFHTKVGCDDFPALFTLFDSHALNPSFINPIEGTTNHGIIQIDREKKSTILGCFNPEVNFSRQEIDTILAKYTSHDILYMQNEIEDVPYIIQTAKTKQLYVVLNPSPLAKNADRLPLGAVDLLILNEEEGRVLTGEINAIQMIRKLSIQCKGLIILTLGSRGSICHTGGATIEQPAYPVDVVDTSGAGDTFAGFLLAGLCQGCSLEQALKSAAKASAIVVSRLGAAGSIPSREEVRSFPG